jgi:hypothetical protein
MATKEKEGIGCMDAASQPLPPAALHRRFPILNFVNRFPVQKNRKIERPGV